MKNTGNSNQNKKVLITGGAILVLIIIGGFVRESSYRKTTTFVYTPSPTTAGQSATLTPISSASATVYPLATYEPDHGTSMSSQSGHPQQPKN